MGGGLSPQAAASPDILWHLLLALAAVVSLGRILGQAFRRIGQPPVIGEVVGGILLGPSFLGTVWPGAYHYLLPSVVVPHLGVVAQLGVIIYMFLIGVELNPDLLRRRVRSTIVISHTSIVVPFALGMALALYLYPRTAPANVALMPFALFVGMAMSITAFPVLARILRDTGLAHSDLGAIVLTCAAIDDITAWCLLAFIVGVVHATGSNILQITLLTAGFIVFMFAVVRPAMRERRPTPGTIATTFVLLLVSAMTTEAIGIHAIFGAFLFGAVIPHDGRLAAALKENLENFATILLLPAFFAFTGMRTEIGLISGVGSWLTCVLITVIATAGKFGGAYAAARLTGMESRQAAGLGALMNTRGLMELIVLNVGLELGVISPALFTMMVIMAIVTTVATAPVLRMLKLTK
jgi:Kef-type K+ transport system membrane component KefB